MGIIHESRATYPYVVTQLLCEKYKSNKDKLKQLQKPRRENGGKGRPILEFFGQPTTRVVKFGINATLPTENLSWVQAQSECKRPML